MSMGLNNDLGATQKKEETIILKNLMRKKEIFFAENATFFEIYVRILALKIGDHLI